MSIFTFKTKVKDLKLHFKLSSIHKVKNKKLNML